MSLSTLPAIAGDLERERDLSVARFLAEDVLEDEEIMRQVRCAMEKDRLSFEAYGGTLSTDGWTRWTIRHLADALKARHG